MRWQFATVHSRRPAIGACREAFITAAGNGVPQKLIVALTPLYWGNRMPELVPGRLGIPVA